jgi:hypothetical protein
MHEILIGDNAFGARTQPADLVTDPAGTVFVTDEYGDQITAVTPSGIKDRWRPTERVSLTDQPMIDPAGNLWFLEAGANLITRIKGVAATHRLQGPDTSSSGPGTSSLPTGPGPGPTPKDSVAVACAAKQWSFGTAAKPRVLLLGNTPAQVTACVGKPTATKGRIWTYGKRLRVTFAAGKVVEFTVMTNALRAKTGDVGIGSPVAMLRRLSTAKVTHDRKTGRYVTVLRVGAKQGAKVVFGVTNKKVTRITVSLVRTSK